MESIRIALRAFCCVAIASLAVPHADASVGYGPPSECPEGEIRIVTEVGGEPAASIRLLQAADGAAPFAEIVHADGKRTWSRLDSWDTSDVQWTVSSRSATEIRGQLRVPTATSVLTYDATYRSFGDGQGELAISEAGSPSGEIIARVETPCSIGLDSPLRNPWFVVGVLFEISLRTCTERQGDALEGCHRAAVESCGAGNVDSFEYSGYCGVGGSCSFSCRSR